MNLTLPTLATVPSDRAAALAIATGEELTRRMHSPRKSINRAAGAMEVCSPLFRESAANPQADLFAPSATFDHAELAGIINGAGDALTDLWNF